MPTKGQQLRRRIQWAGLIGGPVLAAVAYALLPDEYTSAEGNVVKTVAFTPAGRATLAMMVWMAVWWLSEAVDIAVTALLPLAMFPLLGIAPIAAAAAPYADKVIFLFMGGFLLALSMQKWGLDRRIALLTLRVVGTSPAMMVGGFMLVTATLSAFVSNTATAAMMLPIALSVVALVRRQHGAAEMEQGQPIRAEDPAGHFALCMMLGIAYAASIGGIATIIGTPPNVFLVSFVREKIDPAYRMEISFASWLRIGVPLVVVFLPLTWLLLTRVLYPIRIKRIEGGRELIRDQLKALGRTNRGEWATFIVFMCTAIMWITRPQWNDLGKSLADKEGLAGLAAALQSLTDEGIAMTGALLLFIIPTSAKRFEFTMDWSTAVKLPWGILILFGGGLSLAGAVKANGVAEFIGAQTGAFAGTPPIVIVLIVAAVVIFLTELTSNTATTATFVPVLAALAAGLGVHPYLLIFPAALAASCAFMMPVATPPNAIVFGSGYVTIPQMCKAGLWLNLIGVVLVTLLAMSLLGLVLGVKLM